jgi:hypothetical protein
VNRQLTPRELAQLTRDPQMLAYHAANDRAPRTRRRPQSRGERTERICAGLIILFFLGLCALEAAKGWNW